MEVVGGTPVRCQECQTALIPVAQGNRVDKRLINQVGLVHCKWRHCRCGRVVEGKASCGQKSQNHAGAVYRLTLKYVRTRHSCIPA